MAAVATQARRPWVGIPWTRRYRFRSAALPTVTSVTRMVDISGLRQSGGVLRKLVSSLKAPNRISATAQAHIDRIDQTIDFITESVHMATDTHDTEQTHVNYLCRAQVLVDKLSKQKEELAFMKNRRYGSRFAYQLDLVEALDLHDKMLSETVSQFCILSSVLANLGSRAGRQLQPNLGAPATSIGSTELLIRQLFDETRRSMKRGIQHRLTALLVVTVAFF